MLATYMTVTLGLLLLSGVVIGALMSGFVMREQKQNVANEIAVVNELYFNTTGASVGENAAILELNTIARHYDALIQVISLDGSMAQYASGSKWDFISKTRYTEEEITRMLNAVSDLDSSSVRFTQQKGDFQMLIGSKALWRRVATPSDPLFRGHHGTARAVAWVHGDYPRSADAGPISLSPVSTNDAPDKAVHGD